MIFQNLNIDSAHRDYVVPKPINIVARVLARIQLPFDHVHYTFST